MLPSPRLRDFVNVDQDEVKTLILAGLVEHWGWGDDTLNPDLHDIATSYRDGRTVVATCDDHIIGTGTVVRRDVQTAEIV